MGKELVLLVLAMTVVGCVSNSKVEQKVDDVCLWKIREITTFETSDLSRLINTIQFNKDVLFHALSPRIQSIECRTGTNAGENINDVYCSMITTCEQDIENDVVRGWHKEKMEAHYNIVNTSRITRSVLNMTITKYNITMKLAECKIDTIAKPTSYECATNQFQDH